MVQRRHSQDDADKTMPLRGFYQILFIIAMSHVYAEIAARFAVFELVPYFAEEIAAKEKYYIGKGYYNGYFIR
ncbi:MAG: hypothetical protein ACI4JF_05625, partial [Oscillospiraceae bacterium]